MSVIIKERICELCGKKMKVKIDIQTKKISNGFYFGTTKLGIGNWISHKAEWDEKGKIRLVRCCPLYKYIYYTLRDYKRILFHQYIEIEYWECPICYRTETWKGRISIWNKQKL